MFERPDPNPLPPFDAGAVLAETAAVLRARGLVFLAGGLPFLAALIGLGWLSDTRYAARFPLWLGALVVNGLPVVIAAPWSAWVMRMTALRGSGESPLAHAAEVGRRLLPVIALNLMVVLAVAMGLVLLIVPGCIIAVMWLVATPAQVVEGLSMGDATLRSDQLTKGCGLAILGLLALYAAVFVVAVQSGSVLGLSGLVGHGLIRDTWRFATGPVIVLVMSAIGAAGVGAIYTELLRRRTGTEAQAAAEVFS